MSDLILYRERTQQAIVLPEPRVPGGIAIRVAMLDDLAFIDALQKKHSKMVGFLHLETLENKTKAGHVLMAETKVDKSTNQQVKMDQVTRPDGSDVDLSTCRLVDFAAQPVGYCIFQDKYDKHDDCGIFYQVNIAAGNQRGLIGAALVKAALDRAAYGCKLASCWCAQDLEANHFWESLGFVPLAFRTGSRTAGSKKSPRIHIFWQRRIREGDTETPYWFPSETSGGALRENRLALPIPPGTHWSDAKPAILPGMEGLERSEIRDQKSDGGALTSDLCPLTSGKKPRPRNSGGRSGEREKSPLPKRPSCGVWFAPAPGAPGSPEAKAAKKAEKPRREKFKNDPKMVAAARELRDRYIEQINAGLLLPPSACGKYDVSRQLEAAPSTLKQTPLLKAA